jgi:hypothetical protein
MTVYEKRVGRDPLLFNYSKRRDVSSTYARDIIEDSLPVCRLASCQSAGRSWRSEGRSCRYGTQQPTIQLRVVCNMNQAPVLLGKVLKAFLCASRTLA